MDNSTETNSRRLYTIFGKLSIRELEDSLLSCDDREEKAFYRSMINLKLQIAQEKVVGEPLI